MAVKNTKPVESFYLPYTMLKNTYVTTYCASDEDTYVKPVTTFTYAKEQKLNGYITPYSLPFSELMTFSTTGTHDANTSFNVGLGYITYNIDNQIRQLPIDMIINRDALNTLGNYYRGNSPRYFNYTNTTVSTIRNILETENIYYIIKYLRFLDNFALKRNEALYTNTSSMYYQLYNDTVSGEPYCKYIYRAKIKRSDIGFDPYNVNRAVKDLRIYYLGNGNQALRFAKIPVFRVETTDENLNFYIVIRNFKIPMKRVRTSSKAFIYLCPEYILKKYIEFTDSISYIIANGIDPNATYKFNYDYLKDTHLWAHDSTDGVYDNYGIRLGNTNSTISFIE